MASTLVIVPISHMCGQLMGFGTMVRFEMLVLVRIMVMGVTLCLEGGKSDKSRGVKPEDSTLFSNCWLWLGCVRMCEGF